MAAAHWGQEEACKVLVENFANMDTKNFGVSISSTDKWRFISFLRNLLYCEQSVRVFNSMFKHEAR